MAVRLGNRRTDRRRTGAATRTRTRCSPISPHTAASASRSAPLPYSDAAWDSAPASYVRDRYHSYVLDLDGGFDEVWRNRFRSSVRRAVRKAEREHVRVEVDTTGALIEDFDRLYRLSVERWAQAQHEPQLLARWRSGRANPRSKFEVVADRFGERCAVWLAYVGTRPAAGLIVLRHGRHAKYWRGAMDAELAAPVAGERPAAPDGDRGCLRRRVLQLSYG